MDFGANLVGCTIDIGWHQSVARGCRVKVLAYGRSEYSDKMMYRVMNLTKGGMVEWLLEESVEKSIPKNGNLRIPLT